MKIIHTLFVLLFIANAQYTYTNNENSTYRAELTTLQNNPDYQLIFAEDAHDSLKDIQRDVENFKELSLAQRVVRFVFFGLEVIVVTHKTMPKMYSYIQNLCKTHDIATPTVFIAINRGFFNAAAQKLLMSTGAIVIGTKLIDETTDEGLEGIIAHELGHIKYNHVNKSIALGVASYFSGLALTKALSKTNLPTSVKIGLPLFWIFYGPSLMINKRFEREADEFAYKSAGKGKGLIEFFEKLEAKEQKADNDFAQTKSLIQANKEQLSFYGYSVLMYRYHYAKAFNLLSSAFKWMYHHTPFGPHPSHQERIQTIQEYLAQEA